MKTISLPFEGHPPHPVHLARWRVHNKTLPHLPSRICVPLHCQIDFLSQHIVEGLGLHLAQLLIFRQVAFVVLPVFLVVILPSQLLFVDLSSGPGPDIAETTLLQHVQIRVLYCHILCFQGRVYGVAKGKFTESLCSAYYLTLPQDTYLEFDLKSICF